LDDAESLCKKMFRKTNSPYFSVDIGFIHTLNNKPDKATKQFDEVVKNLFLIKIKFKKLQTLLKNEMKLIMP